MNKKNYRKEDEKEEEESVQSSVSKIWIFPFQVNLAETFKIFFLNLVPAEYSIFELISNTKLIRI